ncbi:hypothetical protein BEH94_05265 [Candidatus Altiarchaeales archaeon WOR_SM1_SCG]|nr:hypothetical protein BEH94_05265 [Candidatus Altiarchaeales archaeon WOR_SM1_SCG]
MDANKPNVSIQPQISTPDINETLDLYVRISTINEIGGLQFKLLFNSSVIEVISVDKGPFFSDALEPPGNTINNTVGEVKWAYGLTNPKNGTGDAVKITVKTKSLGASMLDLQGTSQVPNILTDANGIPMTSEVTIIDGFIKVDCSEGDFDKDGTVDILDFFQFCTAWTDDGNPNNLPVNCHGDIDRDNDVDILDFFQFCAAWIG